MEALPLQTLPKSMIGPNASGVGELEPLTSHGRNVSHDHHGAVGAEDGEEEDVDDFIAGALTSPTTDVY